MLKKLLVVISLFVQGICFAYPGKTAVEDRYIQFVFTSDLHYGLTRDKFRGNKNVPAQMVNRAMIAQMNLLPKILFPLGNGLKKSLPVGAIDFIAITGDITNRQEAPVPAASVSWNQFYQDYFQQLTLKNSKGKPSLLLLTPGNHDISNAIGHHDKMKPLVDATALVGIYNSMMQPVVAKTNQTYQYKKDKVNYSKDIGGIHFVFLHLWPDMETRNWLAKDLQKINKQRPVILFQHDPPAVESKHFTNPKGKHSINNKFENLLAEQYQSGSFFDDESTIDHQKKMADFIKQYPNIKALFHGHNNWNEYYTYLGPDKNIKLPVFRVDSPLKGKDSGDKETRLSFQLVTIDTKTKQMTVREVFWNKEKVGGLKGMGWGDVILVNL